MFAPGKIQEPLMLLVILAVFVFTIAMLINVLKNRRGFLAKLFWVGIILVFPLLGALYYFYWADLYHRHSLRSESPKS